MRNISIMVLGVLIFSCSQTHNNNQETDGELKVIKEGSENFDWLLGKWQRLNEEEGKETFENWAKINETEYSGIGFTMQKGDTIKQEKIKLIKSNEQWNLIVKAPEDLESITFIGTSYNDNEFTCENNEIDFPNKIKYWRNGQNINASVSNSEMEISFEFEKLDE